MLQSSPRKTRERKRSWLRPRRLLLTVALAAVALLVFAPRILSLPLFRNALVNWATADLDGRLEIGNLSLGWLAVPQAADVKLFDRGGNPVVELAALKLDRSLLTLLFAKDLGTITLQSPEVHLTTAPGRSNLETILAAWLQPSPEQDANWNRHLQLQIVEGSAQLRCADESTTYRLDGINALLTLGADHSLNLQGRLNTKGPDGRIGQLAVQGEYVSPSQQRTEIRLHLVSESLALDGLRPIFLRWGESCECSGWLGADIEFVWSSVDNESAIRLNQLRGDRLVMAGQSWLSGDRLSINKLDGSGELDYRGGILLARQLDCSSEFARLKADGQVDLNAWIQTLSGGSLPSEDFTLSGQINLARLASMLPHTLRLKSEVQVEAGELAFDVFNRIEGSGRRMLLDAAAQNIVANHQGRPIRWTKPLRVSAAIAQDGGRPRLESIQCESNSVSINGSSDLQSGRVEAQGDLSGLMEELGQLINLDQIKLQGKFTGNASWNARAIDQIGAESWPVEMGGSFDVENLVVAFPGWEPFAEPRATIEIRSQATADQSSITRLNTGRLQFNASGDQLTLDLNTPVENPATAMAWNTQMKASGDLATWSRRLKPLLPDWGIDASGKFQLEGVADLTTTSIRLSPFNYVTNSLAVDAWGMRIREQQVSGEGDVAYDWNQYRLVSNDLTFSGAAVAARAGQFQLSYQSDAWLLSGAVGYRADVNRVVHWFNPASLQGVQWFGEAEGTMVFTPTANSIGGQLTTTVKDLTAAVWQTSANAVPSNQNAGQWQVVWSEPTAQLQSELSLNPDFDAVAFKQIQVQSKMLGVAAEGNIGDLYASMNIDMKGTWIPNWPALSSLIQAYAGNQIQFTGSGQPQRFAIRGPLFDPEAKDRWVSSRLVAQTAIAWDSGNVFGLPMGGGRIEPQLSQSQVRFGQWEVPLSQGRLNLNPIVDLSRSPELLVGPGTIVESIELTPEICRGWMKYVAPILADAARAQGRFSVATDGMKLPLNDPLRGSARGKILIESASISPGPLGQQLIALANSIRQIADGQPLPVVLQQSLAVNPQQYAGAIVDLPEQQFDFSIENGQVVHRGMAMDIRGIRIRSSGTIGVDGALNLIAEIPVLDQWVQKQPLLASWKGTTLRIPIGGTISRPQIDAGAWAAITKELLRQTATQQIESKIGDLINDQLRDKVPGLNTANPNTNPAATPLPDLGDALQKSAEEGLKKGLDRLLGPKK